MPRSPPAVGGRSPGKVAGSMPHATRTLVEALSDAVGSSHVLVDPEVVASYCADWTGRWRGSASCGAAGGGGGRGPASCVVRRGSADGVPAVLRACRSFGAAVVPQGGNTGL